MSTKKRHTTNNQFAKAFHATRLRPQHLTDLEKLDDELQDELEWLCDRLEPPRRITSMSRRASRAALVA